MKKQKPVLNQINSYLIHLIATLGYFFSLFINDVKGFLANRYNCLSGLSSLIRDNLDIDLESYIKLYVLLYVHM